MFTNYNFYVVHVTFPNTFVTSLTFTCNNTKSVCVYKIMLILGALLQIRVY
jgi:hypothetical protein